MGKEIKEVTVKELCEMIRSQEVDFIIRVEIKGEDADAKRNTISA